MLVFEIEYRHVVRVVVAFTFEGAIRTWRSKMRTEAAQLNLQQSDITPTNITLLGDHHETIMEPS